MEAIISLRAFAVDAPTAVETWGLLGQTANGTWEFNHDPAPGRYADAFEQFVADECGDFDAERPALQRVFDGVVVLLDEVVLRVVDDDIECEFRLSTGQDLADGRTICSDRNHAEYGGTAERHRDDVAIANAVQRASDALDHRIEWLDVISPRSLGGVVDAAEDLLDEGDDE